VGTAAPNPQPVLINKESLWEVKKMSKQPRRIRIIPIFPISPDGGLGENFAASAINIGVTLLLAQIGVTWEPPESQHQSSLDQQYKADKYKIQLEKQEVEKVKAQIELLKTHSQLKLLEQKVAEKESKAGKEQTATVSFQKTQLDLQVKTEIISGSLEVPANCEGLTGPGEGQEAAIRWQETLLRKVILLLGKRGSGKTATAAEFGEYIMGKYNISTFWVGLPQRARQLVPRWIHIIEDLAGIPNDSFVICDEAALNYLSLRFGSDRNVTLRQALSLSRQKNWTMVIVAQTSRDIDRSVISQCNSVVFKEPPMVAESERPEIRAKAMKAAQVFAQIPPGERLAMAMVFDDSGFEGLLKVALPSFWTEELSCIFGQVCLAPAQKGGINGSARHLRGAAPVNQSNGYVTDEEIRELRRQGCGYEKIAKMLNVTVYRVRKVLAEYDPLDENPGV